jgi:hypothetical protein
VIPVAAAAAVVAIVLAAITLTGGSRASHDLGANSVAGTATTPPPPGAPHELIKLLRTNAAVTSIVSAKLGASRVYVWFSNLKDDPCYVVVVPGTPDYGSGCGNGPAVWFGERAATDGSLPSIDSGKVVMQATSVTARLSNGRAAPAVLLLSGNGFPFKVWFVRVPGGDIAHLVFRDAAGRKVASLDDTDQVPPITGIPSHGGIVVDGWTAYLVSGRVLWHGPDDGAIVPLPWTVKQKPLMVMFQSTTKVNYALGYTPADVARLELRFPDGTTYSAPTIPAWPGSTVRLWVKTGLPWSGLPPQTLVIRYNSASKVIAQQTVDSILGN